MARIPIYQMTHGQDRSGNAGLVFASEQLEYSGQSILFTIPLVESLSRPFDWLDLFEFETFYFPFLLGEKYYDLDARVNFPELIFSIPEKDIEITFEINEYNYFFAWSFLPFRRRHFGTTKYVGSENQIIPNNIGFLTLLPVDLYEMDELYHSHKGVFVGLTPNFGNIDLDQRKQDRSLEQ